MATPRCTECKHLREDKPSKHNSGRYYCTHQAILSMTEWPRPYEDKGFIGYGLYYQNKPQIKTAPRWCPERKRA